MKRIEFLFMTSLALATFSCNSNKNDNADNADKNKGSELIMTTRSVETTETLTFTGSDIKSFNAATGEIVFKHLAYHDICDSLLYDQKLDFFLDDELLFTATATGSYSSRMINDLVFYYDGKRMYLHDGYPNFEYLNVITEAIKQALQLREQAAKERQPAWERFNRYLSDNNLLTDQTTDVPDENEGGGDYIYRPSVHDLSANITIKGDSTWESTVFIGQAIKSFNPTTREIVFDGYNILANLNEFAPIRMTIYRKGTPLFDATVIDSNKPQTVNDLVFLIDTRKQFANEWQYYLPDGYPELDNLADPAPAAELRQSNAQKRKAEWAEFIKYLSDAGKIVD